MKTRTILSIFVVIHVFIMLGRVSPIFAFLPPLRDLQTWIEGSTIRYKVYYPQREMWMEESDSCYCSELTVKDGVVAWVRSYLESSSPLAYAHFTVEYRVCIHTLPVDCQ